MYACGLRVDAIGCAVNQRLTQFTFRQVAELRARTVLEHETIRGLYAAALASEAPDDSMEPLRAMLAGSVE